MPAFSSPEPAARALARAATYTEWRRRPPGAVPPLDRFDADRARLVAREFLESSPEGGWLESAATSNLLAAIGVSTVASAEVSGAEEAAQAAIDLGFPVALKASGPGLVHKSDIGGVQLELCTEQDVADAFRAMGSKIGSAMTGAVVQQMADTGVETIIGVVQDPLFGPLVMFGLGGVTTELLGDRAFRILPLTDLDAAELVRSLRSSPLFFGYRGSPPLAVAAIEDLLQRVARLAGLVPEVFELDLNPVIVTPGGALTVDARARVEPCDPDALSASSAGTYRAMTAV